MRDLLAAHAPAIPAAVEQERDPGTAVEQHVLLDLRIRIEPAVAHAPNAEPEQYQREQVLARFERGIAKSHGRLSHARSLSARRLTAGTRRPRRRWWSGAGSSGFPAARSLGRSSSTDPGRVRTGAG